MAKIKVVHYINQFFAQIGGEEKADYPAEIRVGEVVGPGTAFMASFKDEAEIIATIICGDSYLSQDRHSMPDVTVWLAERSRLLYRKSWESRL